MPLVSTALFDLAEALLAGLNAHWPGDVEALPDRQYVSNGTIIWDGCESLAVMAEATYGTTGDLAAEQIVRADDPTAMRAGIFGIALIRCVPDVGEDGSPPAASEIQDSASVILSDEEAIYASLQAAQAAGDIVGCSALAFDRWQSEGPQGGLAGGVLRLRALML